VFGFGLSGDSSISTSSSSSSSSDTLKGLLALAALILLCVSVIFSFVEVQYMLWGQTVAATKADVVVHRPHRGQIGSGFRRYVEYTFADPAVGAERFERELVSDTYVLPGMLLINFVPGGGLSRLDGSSYWWALLMLGTSVMFVVAMAIWFYIDFAKYQRHRAQKRRAGY